MPRPFQVFLLLLLFFIPCGLGKDCFWKHRPFPTTGWSNRVRTLKQWLLLDYPVFVPTNLKPDEFCQKIWDLHFINRELIRMFKISGENLSVQIKTLIDITNFVADCKIKEDGCIHFERRNVSQFLESFLSTFTALQDRFDEEDIDYSNCTSVQCQLDYATTPDTKQAEQNIEGSQSSQADTSRKHYWWLILLPTSLLLFLAFVVGPRLQCRKQPQRSPRNQESAVCAYRAPLGNTEQE